MRLTPIVVAIVLSQSPPGGPTPPAARQLAPDTDLLPGSWLPDRGPDGNTVMIAGPKGLIAIDTGRHPWQSDGILAVARARRQPVTAIVNTHWHLDHSSGNRRVKAVFPEATLYASPAIDRALAADGFLTRNLAAARAKPLPPDAPALRREETELFFSTMEAAGSLRPDVPVTESGTLTLAGRPLAVHVAVDAVTDGDLWLYDESTGIAVIGDLVTLPAPFFETACPARWQAALDEVSSTPFRVAVPGHGPPMTRGDFDAYRRGFAAFRACTASDSAPGACASGWVRDLGALLTSDADRKQAVDYAAYYVEFLRKNGGASPDCRAK